MLICAQCNCNLFPFVFSQNNVFTIGKGNAPWVSLPSGDGIKLTRIEERDQELANDSDASSDDDEEDEEDDDDDEELQIK